MTAGAAQFCDRCGRVRPISQCVPATRTAVPDAIVAATASRTDLNWLRKAAGAEILAVGPADFCALRDPDVPCRHQQPQCDALIVPRWSARPPPQFIPDGRTSSRRRHPHRLDTIYVLFQLDADLPAATVARPLGIHISAAASLQRPPPVTGCPTPPRSAVDHLSMGRGRRSREEQAVQPD